MSRHMRTSIDLSTAAFNALKKLAAENGVTMKELVERAVREIVENSKKLKRGSRTLPDYSYGGEGISTEYAGLPWSSIRDTIYGLSVDRKK